MWVDDKLAMFMMDIMSIYMSLIHENHLFEMQLEYVHELHFKSFTGVSR